MQLNAHYEQRDLSKASRGGLPERPPDAVFKSNKLRRRDRVESYFPPSTSLAMVANCMLEVPS